MKDTSLRTSAPLLYRAAKDMNRRGVRGSWRLLQTLLRTGQLDEPVVFPLNAAISIVVPIWRNHYDQYDLNTYEMEFVGALGKAIRELPAPVTLVDCGADIGLFSLKMISLCPSIERVIAFEPNSEGFRWLSLNLSRLSILVEPHPSAVADFEGRGRLAAPQGRFAGSGERADHTAFFIEPSAEGPIAVTTIDALPSSSARSIVIKLDLEGGELAAIRGAMKTIAAVPNVIVAVEAHPTVAQRTGIDPCECLRLLNSVRPFRFRVGETGDTLNTDRRVFEQIAPDQIYNIIGQTIG